VNRSQTPPPAQRITLPPVLREFAWITLAITFLSILYCLTAGLIFHRVYPYTWPFFPSNVRFNDFTIYQQKFHLFHQAAFFTTDWPFTYPAPVAMLYLVFYRAFGPHALAAFLISLSLAFAIPAILFARALMRRGIALDPAIGFTAMLLFLSWPALLLLDRANMEVFVWIATATAIWAYSRGREWTAATLFGVAAAFKLFPFVLLALFFTPRKYPKLLYGLAICAAITLASLAILGPTIPIAYHGIARGLTFFHDSYMTHYNDETGLDHTPLAFLKTLVALTLRTRSQPVLDKLAHVYLPLAAVVGLLLYFLRIRRMPWLNQVLVLSIAAIYFSPFSGDGTLIHLYPAFALCCFVAIDAWRRGIEVPGLRVMIYSFAYLFAIESFLVIRQHRLEGQAKCVALAILIVWALRYPLGEPPADAPLDLLHPNTAQFSLEPEPLKASR
jgi:hypothetical protein